MESDQSLTQLKGVGARLSETLARLDIFQIQDLLFHFPIRYENRTKVTPIAKLRFKELAVVDGEIVGSKIQYGKRRSLLITIRDASSVCHMRLFHFSRSQGQQLADGKLIRIIGEPSRGSKGVEFYHPEYKLFQDETPALETTLTPIYSICEGITSPRLRQLIQQALNLESIIEIPDLLPKSLSNEFGAFSLSEALNKIHLPEDDIDASKLVQGMHPLQRRLALEELIAHSLSSIKLKTKIQEIQSPTIKTSKQYLPEFLARLPFKLTNAQQKVFQEIEQNLSDQSTMRRLVQGDVGSGKTIVAALSAITAIENGYQVALMVPTEILAEQHNANFKNWLEPLGINIALLLGKHSAKQKKIIVEKISQNECQLVIGTHALFQKEVDFAKLGLIIIDEQHRFGVHQRLSLSEKAQKKGLLPHQLIMTATPIPRSLAMTIYGDLDSSVIDELPPGRKPVKTVLIDNKRRGEVIKRISEVCSQGKQAYWVCTLIEESESLQAQAAEDLFESLQTDLPNLKIGLVHGRLKADEKTKIIDAFREGNLDCLVATTVIEVGVDIPNASLMIIENPERLGLAQLHQLRGRVGRGANESFCVLLYESPLGQLAKRRLGILRDSNDGFVIAEEDLLIRGPGEVLGTRQAGAAFFKVADLMRDSDLLEKAKESALLVNQNQSPESQVLIDLLIKRWLGDKEKYGEV